MQTACLISLLLLCSLQPALGRKPARKGGRKLAGVHGGPCVCDPCCNDPDNSQGKKIACNEDTGATGTRARVQAAMDFLQNNQECTDSGDVGEEFGCHDQYLILQAHHDHCDHHTLPTEAENVLHDFEDKYDDCYIKREYVEDLDDCPVLTATQCANTADLQAAVDALTNITNNCTGDCSSDTCKNAIQKVLMSHDTCPEDQLPTTLENALHDYEDACEEQLCNSADGVFDPYDTTCPAEDPATSAPATTDSAAAGGSIGSMWAVLSAAVMALLARV